MIYTYISEKKESKICRKIFRKTIFEKNHHHHDLRKRYFQKLTFFKKKNLIFEHLFKKARNIRHEIRPPLENTLISVSAMDP